MGQTDKLRFCVEYMPAYTTHKRFTLITGGRGSLKSSTACDLLARLTYEKGHGILATRYTMKALEMSVLPEVEDAIEKLGTSHHFHKSGNRLTNILTGSFILFSGIKVQSKDQTASLKSLKGITTWFIDEMEDFVDEKAFDKINRSIRGKGTRNRVIMVMNPATKEHFVYKRFIQPYLVKAPFKSDNHTYMVSMSNHPKVEHIHTTYHLAKRLDYIDQDFVDEAEDLEKRDKAAYEHAYMGGWLERAEGCIFTDWSTQEKFPDHLPFAYGLDFGGSHPFAMVKVAKASKTLYVQQLIYKANIGLDELENLMLNVADKKRITVADSARVDTIRDLKNRGWTVYPCRKPPGSVVAGVTDLQSYHIVICGNSVNIVEEFNNYAWSENKINTPVDDWNHAIDAIRYGKQKI